MHLLTTAKLYWARLGVHRECLKVHWTTGFYRQPEDKNTKHRNHFHVRSICKTRLLGVMYAAFLCMNITVSANNVALIACILTTNKHCYA